MCKRNANVIIVLIVFLFIYIPEIFCQSGVQPTPITGSNSVSYNSALSRYDFKFNGKLQYSVGVPIKSSNGGTFNVLTAYADDGTRFLPSNFGGIQAILNGKTIHPYDSGVIYELLGRSVLNGDTVVNYWEMKYGTDYIKYKLKYKITGRTLIIKAEVDNEYKDKVIQFGLDRCDSARTPAPIAIPYMPLFHILYSNDIFTSFFPDWELSNASELLSWNGSSYSDQSIKYTCDIVYKNKTDGSRNRMMETLYLTTSPNLEDVFPNIPNPVSGYKDTVANQIVWDYRQPFGRLIYPQWNYLKKLWDAGVKNVWVQIHDWQNYHNNPMNNVLTGYDDALPCVLPPNSNNSPNSEYGGKTILDSIAKIARLKYGYRVGLHENYVDYYPNSTVCGAWDKNDVGLDPDGNWTKTFYNQHKIRIQSYLLKPSIVDSVVSRWSSLIQKSIPYLNGCYLDVHSAFIPHSDYNSSVPNTGMYRETVKQYRKLYPILRKNHGGPVQGEGGAQFLFQGYADDIEARLVTPGNDRGYTMPMLVNFDLAKLHSKTMVHGVGFFPLWKSGRNYNDILSYIATELAYGHGAYFCDQRDTDPSVSLMQHAQLQYKYVFSVQKDFANATATEIQYNDNGAMKSVSDYIRSHPVKYKDISTDDFMGQVKITYDNGVIVCVNRHPTRNWKVKIGKSNGWFDYHTDTAMDTGICPDNSFDLPPKNGWVVYDPFKVR